VDFLPGSLALDRDLGKVEEQEPDHFASEENHFFWMRGKTSQVKSNKERVYQLVRDYPVFLSAEKKRGKRFILGPDSRLFRLFNTILKLIVEVAGNC